MSEKEISINSLCSMSSFHAFMCDLFLAFRYNWFLSDIYFINFFMLGLHWSDAAFAPRSHIRWQAFELQFTEMVSCRCPEEDKDLLESEEIVPTT